MAVHELLEIDVDLLHRQALDVRPERLGDPFEGSFTRANIENEIEAVRRAYLDGVLETDEQLARMNEMRQELRHMSRDFARIFMYLNCWHVNQYESAAMWDLYTKGTDGVVLQSTFRRLGDSSIETGSEDYEQVDMYAGLVEYIDYDVDFSDELNAFNPFMFKQKTFQHENELRLAFVLGLQADESIHVYEGLHARVDLEILIERVYVSPASGGWFRDVVAAVTERFGRSGEMVAPSSQRRRPLC